VLELSLGRYQPALGSALTVYTWRSPSLSWQLGAAQPHRGGSTPGTPLRQIEAAAERHPGPFLEGVSFPDAPDFEAWMEEQRVRWLAVESELLEGLAMLHAQSGKLGEALAVLERLALLNPADELAWRRLLELQLRREDPGGAQRTWRAYLSALVELDAPASVEMSTLAARIEGIKRCQSATTLASPAELSDLHLHGTPFVGRHRQWSRLFAAYERVKSGRTEVVVVTGPAGAGKTRLASEFLESIKAAGADALAGRGLDVVGELPYSALIDGLRSRLEDENAPDDLLGDLWLSELSRLLPELRERYPDLPQQSGEPVLQRGRLFEAVARLGQAMAARMPLAFWLDDAQWTGADTRDLVRYAVRRWSESGTLSSSSRCQNR
jgi:hypothetical protein